MNVDRAAELAALQAVDTSTLTPKQFTAHVARLEKLMTRIESYRLRTLDSFEASGAFDVDAARTPTDWLASQTGTQRRIAGSRMHLVRRLRSMPFTYPAFADGAITEGKGRPVGQRQLADGTVIPLPVLLNWRCEAEVSRSWLDAHGEMLSYKRDERYANRELRRALAARDRGCAVPGCDRPPAHCDAHHVVFWEDFGPTDIDNLVLLCRHHHRSVHAERLSIRIIDGVPRFYDVTGSLIRESRHRPPEARAA